MKSRTLFLLFFILAVASTQAKIRHSTEQTEDHHHAARFVEKSAQQHHTEQHHKNEAESTQKEKQATKVEQAVSEKVEEHKASKFLAEKATNKVESSKAAATTTATKTSATTHKIKQTLSKAKKEEASADKLKFKQTLKRTTTTEEEEETEEEQTGNSVYTSTGQMPADNRTPLMLNGTSNATDDTNNTETTMANPPGVGAEFENVQYVQQLDPTILRDIKYINDPSQHTKLERVGMNEYKIDGIVYETPTIYGDVVYHSLTDSTTVGQQNLVDKQRLWGQNQISTYQSDGIEYQEVNNFGNNKIPVDTKNAAPKYWRPPSTIRAFAGPEVTQTVQADVQEESIVTPKILKEQKQVRDMLSDVAIPHSKIAQHIMDERGTFPVVQLGGSNPTIPITESTQTDGFLTAQYETPEIRYDGEKSPENNFEHLKEAVEESLQQGQTVEVETKGDDA